jgi:hypothetical protein
MKSTKTTIAREEFTNPRFWEPKPQPLPLPVVAIGSLILGAALTLLCLI